MRGGSGLIIKAQFLIIEGVFPHYRVFFIIHLRFLDIKIRLSSVTSRLLRSFFRVFHLYLSRLQSEILVAIPVFLLALIIVNLFSSKSLFQSAKENLIQNPNSVSSRLTLARQLYTDNQLTPAKKELASALSSPNLTPDQKQAINDLQQKIEDRQTQPEKIKSDIMALQKTADDLPNYRDVYLKLSILNWKIYRLFDAKKYVDKSLGLDPNNIIARHISEAINN